MEAQAPPAHRIITGPLAAIEPAVVEHVFAAKGGDLLKPVVILVGETLLRPYLRRRIADLGGPHLNIHVMTPAELGLRLGEPRMIAAGRRPLPVLAGRVLAHEAALRTGAGYFDAVRHTPGFAAALHATLTDLRRAGFSPAALAGDGAELREREKVLALAGLARAYERLRTAHYDVEDALAAADAHRLNADELIVYGLWEAPELLRRALAGIAAGSSVTAYFPTAHPTADGAHALLRAWLRDALGAEEQPAAAPPTAREGMSTSLAHLQACIGRSAFAPTPSPADRTVQIVSAPDPSREARAALRACMKWARKGIALHEMAIAYRHPEPYRPLLAAIAREAKLPLYDQEGTPLAELPAGRRSLALLDLLENDFDRGSVIAFATDNRLPEEVEGRYAGSAAQWDRISREAGVVRGREQWADRLAGQRERLSRRIADAPDEDPPPPWLHERIGHIDGLARFVEDLAEAIAARPQDASWSEHIAHLEGTFSRYLQEQKPILDAVRELARLDGLTGAVSRDRFSAVVRSVIAGLRSTEAGGGRPGAFRARGINLIDVNSLRQLRFRAVCVLGLAERSFPPPPRQDPLLLDDERKQLGLPPRAHGPDPEPLQFALGVHAAQERLLLSHPRTEHNSGRPLLASSFLRAAAETLAGEPVSAEALPELPQPWLIRLAADRVGAVEVGEALDEADYDRTLLERDPAIGLALMARRRPNAGRGRTALLARVSEGPLNVYEGGLSEAVRASLARHPRVVAPMSATALEHLAACPLRFFLSRVLELREFDEPEEIAQLTALDRGALMHRVMERVMRRWLPDDPPSPQRAGVHLHELEEIAREECDAAQSQGLTGYPALWEADRDSILMDLRLWYQAEANEATADRFDSADFEVGFGLPFQPDEAPHSSADPLELTVGGRRLRVYGRIDRMQWGHEGFQVIDYKTGSHRIRKTDVFKGGELLQLPLYLHGAGDVILGTGWRRGRAEYFFSTRKGGFRRECMSGERLAACRDDFERIVSGFAQAIEEGSFPARPGRQTCRYCDFRSLCPAVTEHEARMARRVDDPRVARLKELSEIP